MKLNSDSYYTPFLLLHNNCHTFSVLEIHIRVVLQYLWTMTLHLTYLDSVHKISKRKKKNGGAGIPSFMGIKVLQPWLSGWQHSVTVIALRFCSLPLARCWPLLPALTVMASVCHRVVLTAWHFCVATGRIVCLRFATTKF